MITKKIFIFTASVVLMLFSTCLYGQVYKFRQYNTGEGIPQSFIYTITQDKQGYLWIGTGDGLSRFNGIQFNNFGTGDSLCENFISCSYKDKTNRLWFGHKNGGISLYDGKKFQTVLHDHAIKSIINEITEDNIGNIWCVSQNDGLVKIDRNRKSRVYETESPDYLFYSLYMINDNRFIAGTNRGLIMGIVNNKKNLLQQIQLCTAIPPVKVLCIKKSIRGNGFWIGTDEGMYYIETSGETFTLQNFADESIMNQINKINVQYILEDNKNFLWIATFGKGAYQLELSAHSNRIVGLNQYNKNNGLEDNFIRYIFKDIEGNIWFGTYGNGLIHWKDNFFAFYYNRKESEQIIPVYSLCFNKGIRWFGLQNRIIEINKGKSQQGREYSSGQGVPEDKITALYRDNAGTLWIGTDKNGLFFLDEKSGTLKKYFLSDDNLVNSINAITGQTDDLWIATKNGLIKLNRKTKSRVSYTTQDGLPHNNINDVFIDHGGKILVVSNSNTICIFHNNRNDKLEIVSNDILTITSIEQDKQGNYWFSTYGNGVYKLEKNTLHHITTRNGLKSNYCYSLVADRNDNIWVGHRLGLSKISRNRITSYGQEHGITSDCQTNSAVRDETGNIWFGTSNGMIRYDPRADFKNIIPPALNIVSVYISGREFGYKKHINLAYGNYKLKVDYIGISLKEPEHVQYQYKLEISGKKSGWSDLSDINHALFNNLTEGDYTFYVRACNSDGIFTQEPKGFQISIALPFWKKWWVVILSLLIVTYLVYSIIVFRERRLKQIQEKLEVELDRRTSEVIRHKQEIEESNIKITDSISYAKRIQLAILPSKNKLREKFPESFIFYRAKDIVSGDFYWFKNFNDNFIIACGDATGHGVPGAFMSLIGINMIKEICHNKEANSPSEVLRLLDEELKNTLAQDRHDTNSKDGMDISICEINLQTRCVRFASAMRPIFIYTKGVFLHVRGNRYSIGGKYSRKKLFVDQEFNLKPGDIIYMFTDGYTDQFGGKEGKKIKVNGLKLLLESICHKSMEEQYIDVRSRFNNWKKGYEQLDDVLVIGIKMI